MITLTTTAHMGELYITGLCTKCTGYINNLVITAQNSGTVTPNLVPPKRCPAWALIEYKLYTVDALGLGLGWGLVLIKR